MCTPCWYKRNKASDPSHSNVAPPMLLRLHMHVNDMRFIGHCAWILSKKGTLYSMSCCSFYSAIFVFCLLTYYVFSHFVSDRKFNLSIGLNTTLCCKCVATQTEKIGDTYCKGKKKWLHHIEPYIFFFVEYVSVFDTNNIVEHNDDLTSLSTRKMLFWLKDNI